MRMIGPRLGWRVVRLAMLATVVGIAALGDSLPVAAQGNPPTLAALPQAPAVNRNLAELGRHLFFDPRLSGDWALSCASCHDPAKGWADGEALSTAYPGGEYFRSSPSIINARYRARFMWDGRLDGGDLGTLVRDMVTEAHFMNSDGRLIQERLTQVPEYMAMWEQAFGKGSEPYGPRMFNAIAEYVRTIVSRNVPLDRHLSGEQGAISAQAKEGLRLFEGKAGCIQCHHGPLASDGKLHTLGVPENPAVWSTPLRAITMLRFYSTLGMPNYMNARTDVGLYAVTKDPRDRGKFLTPSLRELVHTAPYMHNGVFATLADVVDFYDRGGGPGGNLKPIGLGAGEKEALIAFLRTLSGDPIPAPAPELPELKLRPLRKN